MSNNDILVILLANGNASAFVLACAAAPHAKKHNVLLKFFQQLPAGFDVSCFFFFVINFLGA